MAKNFRLLSGALFSGVALLSAATLPASAATTGDTVTTFTLGGGSIGITVASTATLSGGNSGAVLVTGSLGNVTVTDNRGNLLGWTASAASTTFTSDSGTPNNATTSTAVTYSAGSITKTGTVTATSSGTVPVSAVAAPVVLATLTVGNNTASWNPTLSVTLPPTSLAGLYTGTVTTSVA